MIKMFLTMAAAMLAVSAACTTASKAAAQSPASSPPMPLVHDLNAPAPPPSQHRPVMSADDMQPVMNLDNVQDAFRAVCSGKQKGRGVVSWTADPHKVRCLTLRETMSTVIWFPPGLIVASTILGDNRYFAVEQIRNRPNLLRIYASGGVGADTQLTVITKPVEPGETKTAGNYAPDMNNVFTFYLRSIGVTAFEVPDVTVFIRDHIATAASDHLFPQERLASQDAFAQAPQTNRVEQVASSLTKARDGEWLRPLPFDAANLKFSDYRILAIDEESMTIAPLRAFHDGVFTYLDFGEDGRSDRVLQPVAHRVVDGVDSRVNQRMAGPNNNILVIEGIGTITLRNGQRVVCIVYQGSPVSVPPSADILGEGPASGGDTAARSRNTLPPVPLAEVETRPLPPFTSGRQREESR